MGRPKRRRLGQNFLVDRTIADRIAALLADEPPRVVEIGPGRGSLTEPLLDRFGRVLAIELDGDLVPALEERFGGRGLDLRHADALSEDLDTMLASGAPWQVASNLPYSVGTAILRRLMPRHDLFTRLVVMLQTEVAARVVARPGDKNHGLLALERAAWAEAEMAFQVSPRAFRPRPKVMSSVVVLNLRSAPIASDRLERGLRLAAHALTKPRKMISNALRPLADVAAIEGAALDPNSRPAELSLDDWVRLAELSKNA
jgi:16S rRNA (adenine1518-N6/adenine1519-N6)-dimethyltransferase